MNEELLVGRRKRKRVIRVQSFILAIFIAVLVIVTCMFVFFFNEFRHVSRASDQISEDLAPAILECQKNFINLDSLRYLISDIRSSAEFASARNSFYNAQQILVDVEQSVRMQNSTDSAELQRQLQMFWYKRLKLEGLRQRSLDLLTDMASIGMQVSGYSKSNLDAQKNILNWGQRMASGFSSADLITDRSIADVRLSASTMLGQCRMHASSDDNNNVCRIYEEDFRKLVITLSDFQENLVEFNIIYDYFRSQLNAMVLDASSKETGIVLASLNYIKKVSDNSEVAVFLCLLLTLSLLFAAYILIKRFLGIPLSVIERMIRISHSKIHRPRNFPTSSIREIDNIFSMLPKVYDDLHMSRVEAKNSNTNYMRLLDVSMKDELTGALNRRALDTFMSRNSMVPAGLCVMMVDIDHFKSFNDERGHQYGDYILKLIAATLMNSLSEKSADRVFRFGGEEFVIIVQDIESRMRKPIAERLCERVRALHVPNSANDTGLLTISVGCSIVAGADAASSIPALISQADVALYEAKRLGRNRVILASKNS